MAMFHTQLLSCDLTVQTRTKGTWWWLHWIHTPSHTQCSLFPHETSPQTERQSVQGRGMTGKRIPHIHNVPCSPTRLYPKQNVNLYKAKRHDRQTNPSHAQCSLFLHETSPQTERQSVQGKEAWQANGSLTYTGKRVPQRHVPYLSASAVSFPHWKVLHQVYGLSVPKMLSVDWGQEKVYRDSPIHSSLEPGVRPVLTLIIASEISRVHRSGHYTNEVRWPVGHADTCMYVPKLKCHMRAEPTCWHFNFGTYILTFNMQPSVLSHH